LFSSLGQGANPWKTVTILEELGLPYETIFLEFGNVKNGVEGSDFLKKNPAGRVPLIYDPQTGKTHPYALQLQSKLKVTVLIGNG
jgi:glutathione S-transferase